MKITCQDILDAIEKVAPVSLCYDWDNCGLLVGNRDAEIKKVITCLDLDMSVIKEAKKQNANMILSHHPFFFYEKKRYTDDDYYMRVLKEMMKNDFCYYAGHTNMDIAEGGINDVLGEKIGFPSAVDFIEKIDEENGIGRIYLLKEPILVKELCKKVKNGLCASHISYTGSPDKRVKKIAVCSGSGQSMTESVMAKNCDVYITGDFRHDPAKDYIRRGLSLILIRHYDSEIIINEVYNKILKNAFGDALTVAASKTEEPVFHTFNE